jgi:hypothetical protein
VANDRCFVCGHFLGASPRSSEWAFEFCPCCGSQFGYQDASPGAVSKSRLKWLSGGARWHKTDLEPQGWSLARAQAQLQLAPALEPLS